MNVFKITIQTYCTWVSLFLFLVFLFVLDLLHHTFPLLIVLSLISFLFFLQAFFILCYAHSSFSLCSRLESDTITIVYSGSLHIDSAPLNSVGLSPHTVHHRKGLSGSALWKTSFPCHRRKSEPIHESVRDKWTSKVLRIVCIHSLHKYLVIPPANFNKVSIKNTLGTCDINTGMENVTLQPCYKFEVCPG